MYDVSTETRADLRARRDVITKITPGCRIVQRIPDIAAYTPLKRF